MVVSPTRRRCVVIVAMESEVATATATQAEDRTASVSAYVNRPIVDVVAQFSDPGIDGLLMSTMRRVTGTTGLGDVLSVHAWPTVWVASGSVRVNVTWRIRGADGRSTDGAATIALLTVQSGGEPITELLARLPVGDGDPRAATDTARRLLDELTLRMEARVR